MDKKTIIISNYDSINNPFYGGGGAYAIHEVAKRLVNEYNVTVITGKYPSCKNEVIDGIQYERIGLTFASPKIGQILFYLALFYYIHVKKFDLWIENFTPPFSTNFLQLFTNKPVVGLLHMTVGAEMKRKYKIPFDIIEKIGVKTYKYLVTTTDTVNKKIAKINKKAVVHTIPNGVSIPDINIISEDEKKHILFLGRIEIDQKGIDLLLLAYKQIADHIPYKLVIAGTGITEEMITLKKLVKKYNLEDKVEMIGKITNGTKDTIINHSVFAVVPSRFETFSMVALEYLAYGKPIITFDIEGLNWIPQGSRITVPAFDTNEFAKAIQLLSTNAQVRNSMSPIGMKFATTHTWDTIADKYKTIIRQLI